MRMLFKRYLSQRAKIEIQYIVVLDKNAMHAIKKRNKHVLEHCSVLRFAASLASPDTTNKGAYLIDIIYDLFTDENNSNGPFSNHRRGVAHADHFLICATRTCV